MQNPTFAVMILQVIYCKPDIEKFTSLVLLQMLYRLQRLKSYNSHFFDRFLV